MADSDEIVFVYCVFETPEQAKRICRGLVEKRLAACANILGRGESVYRWQGRVEEAAEVYAILKTKACLFERVRDEIVSQHGYDVPCVVALDVARGHAPFIDWIKSETC